MASNVCNRFVHNAWKKDFCSNCFKSKEEHKVLKETLKPLKIPQPDATPSKSIIKSNAAKKKKQKVSFPKELSEVIGFGGEWADSDQSDELDGTLESPPQPAPVQASAVSSPISVDLALEQDFSKITKSNTDFNMNINNLLGKSESNIKRSFAALRLGSSTSSLAKDNGNSKESKKETLKISVQPFGANTTKSHNKVNEMMQIFVGSGSTNGNGTSAVVTSNGTAKKTQLTVSASPQAGKKTDTCGPNKIAPIMVQPSNTLQKQKMDNEMQVDRVPVAKVPNNSPEIVSVTEKSLLEEISETLEKNKNLEMAAAASVTTKVEVVDSVLKKDPLAVRLEIKNPLNKVLPSLPDKNTNTVTATSTNSNQKRLINRNVPITKDHVKPKISVFSKKFETVSKEDDESDVSDVEADEFYDNVPTETGKDTRDQLNDQTKSSFFSSQLISDMFLANKPISKHLKKHSEVYDLSDRTYGKITSDGLIMTKIVGENGDSRSSSNFDSSSSSSCSDEETTTQRSESDSGIVSNEYQNVIVLEQISECANSSDPNMEAGDDFYFKDSAIGDSNTFDDNTSVAKTDIFSIEKSRELAGEPDGSSDPDSNSEAPELPTTAPPSVHEQKSNSFLHSLTKHLSAEKPKIPLKPNHFLVKKSASPIEEEPPQLNEPQLSAVQPEVAVATTDKLVVSRQSSTGSDLKGGTQKKGRAPDPPPSPLQEAKNTMRFDERSVDPELNTIYMRNPMANLKSNSPVVREKDKRERATVNPKFRSLNSINNIEKNRISSRATTPEPMPRKSLSLSHENLLLDGVGVDGKAKNGKKNKLFSIKKFLRMGSSSVNLSASVNKLSDSALDLSGGATRTDGGSNSTTGTVSPRAKPRLVIIHPIDINTSGVEVVKTTPTNNLDITKMVDEKVVAGKPPAPPIRVNSIDSSKPPSRPPPPKNAETQQKQHELLTMQQANDAKPAKSQDNVYANLGEVRSAIAPRKPERTASMREREERQMELLKKRAAFKRSEEEKLELETPPLPGQVMEVRRDSMGQGKLPPSKVEIFERMGTKARDAPKAGFLKNDGIKSSVQKMSSTIDSYLKDKQINNDLESSPSPSSSSPPSPPVQQTMTMPTTMPVVVGQQVASNLITNKFNSTNSIMKDFSVPSPSTGTKKMHFNESVEMRHYEPVIVSKQDRMSLPDQADNGSVYGGSTYGNNNFNTSTPKGASKSFAHLPRAISMSYCGSEMGESEIYSPYSFCGSEAGNDVAFGDPQEGWGTGSQLGKSRTAKKTTNRLRMRKGRSVMHNNLEDNYGAVIVANHEALAQVLDQLQQSPTIPPQLRPLANSINLRFEDFSIMEGGRAVVIGRRAFHAAIWANQIPVTLALTADCNQMSAVSGDFKQASGAASGALNPIAEFCDLVPSNYLPLMPSIQIRMVQGSISVLPRMYVDTLMSLGSILKSKMQENTNQLSQAKSSALNLGGSIPNLATVHKESVQKPVVGSVQNINMLAGTNNEDTQSHADLDELDSIVTLLPKNPIGFPSFEEIMCREVGFVMLQLVNGLKNLQAKGIEEMPASLSNVILCKEMENKEAQARLCVLQSFAQDFNRDDEDTLGTLCQCAHVALTQMLPPTKLTPMLADILQQERAESLSKIKSILEFALWGPSDVTLNGTPKEREQALQRWLDLERATVLHGLVRTRVELTVYDECHLMFLVRSTAKVMTEASTILHRFLDGPNPRSSNCSNSLYDDNNCLTGGLMPRE